MTRRLWDKGDDLDAELHRFTVGDDPAWDRRLVHWDCLGSAAHALTLVRAGVLTEPESRQLIAELDRIDADDRAGRFEIPPELEDCHTAIEARLTRALGEVGEKIHAGRSRNDQVATAMRLYLRRHAVDWVGLLGDFATSLLDRIAVDGHVPMPGYTHMQPAMPSSVGQWLHAYVEAALEQARAALDLHARLDGCPLGTGAGFGVPLPLDRAYTAELLGFSRMQRSPIDVQNSRGRMETYFMRVAADCGAMIEKLSWDLILFSGPAFGFFTLPEAMTTGSSLMPQKRNPDVLELLRARGGWLRGRLHELEWVAGKLPSSYHRDLQLTKGPAIAAAEMIEAMLPIAARVAGQFEIHAGALRSAMTPELYATDAALGMVRQGVPFRQAYRRVADELRAGRFTPPAGADSAAADETRRVAPALVQTLREEIAAARAQAAAIRTRIDRAEMLLTSA